MNNVTLIGRLTKDPETRYANGDMAVCRFTLAVNRENGSQEADFIPCVAFKKQAENIQKYITKGRQLAVTGRIQTGSYEKDGRRVYTTDVIVSRAEFIGNKGESNNNRESSAGVEDAFMAVDENIPF